MVKRSKGTKKVRASDPEKTSGVGSELLITLA
ncbi:MAG: hypothetical protein BMS9Abin13_037 [Patescibacteria group bacterium]|nr:MAG: hypothetical protein BMS9Abin13_037 [Patescibacteria group bacterium]